MSNNVFFHGNPRFKFSQTITALVHKKHGRRPPALAGGGMPFSFLERFMLT